MRVMNAIEFSQSRDGLSQWAADQGFVYDIAYPDDINEHEITDVIAEVFFSDAYKLQTITQPGDVWVDVGCHVGLFSIAAMQAGAQVGVVVDMDATRLYSADVNTRLFSHQSRARGLYPSDCVDVYSYLEEIRNVDQLTDLAKICSNDFFPSRTRTCLKMDIQGAERSVFNDTQLGDLAKHYQLMVFEYHDSDLDVMAMSLEKAGWYIEKMQKHFDVLLNIETYLVWAVSG